MRVAVTGGRDCADRAAVYRALDAVRRKHPAMILVHGGARGADTLADEWAHDRGVPVEVFPADWEQHGKRAGIIRNREMVRSKLSGCVAFPGGTGTADMVKACKVEGVSVWDLRGSPRPAPARQPMRRGVTRTWRDRENPYDPDPQNGADITDDMRAYHDGIGDR